MYEQLALVVWNESHLTIDRQTRAEILFALSPLVLGNNRTLMSTASVCQPLTSVVNWNRLQVTVALIQNVVNNLQKQALVKGK